MGSKSTVRLTETPPGEPNSAPQSESENFQESPENGTAETPSSHGSTNEAVNFNAASDEVKMRENMREKSPDTQQAEEFLRFSFDGERPLPELGAKEKDEIISLNRMVTTEEPQVQYYGRQLVEDAQIATQTVKYREARDETAQKAHFSAVIERSSKRKSIQDHYGAMYVPLHEKVERGSHHQVENSPKMANISMETTVPTRTPEQLAATGPVGASQQPGYAHLRPKTLKRRTQLSLPNEQLLKRKPIESKSIAPVESSPLRVLEEDRNVEINGSTQSSDSSQGYVEWLAERGGEYEVLNKQMQKRVKEAAAQRAGATSLLTKKAESRSIHVEDDTDDFYTRNVMENQVVQPLYMGNLEEMPIRLQPLQLQEDPELELEDIPDTIHDQRNRNSIEDNVEMPFYLDLGSTEYNAKEARDTSTTFVQTVAQIHNDRGDTPAVESSVPESFVYTAGDYQYAGDSNNFQSIGEVEYPEEDHVVPHKQSEWMQIVVDTNAVVDPEYRNVQVQEGHIVSQNNASQVRSHLQANATESNPSLIPASETNGTEEAMIDPPTEVKLEVYEGPSKRGVWNVYRVTEPEEITSTDGKSTNRARKCRTYIHDKEHTKQNEIKKQTYICSGCRDIYKLRKSEKIKQKTIVARMIVYEDGKRFEIHPSCSQHDPDCHPVDLSVDESKRALYSITRQIRNKEIVKKPKALQIHALKGLNDSPHLTNKECVDAVAQYGVFVHHKSAYIKANQEAMIELPTLEIIPEKKQISHIRNEVDGENEKELFVRLITTKEVVCYVDQVFRMAKERDVDTLISDGAYSLAPREWGANTQVYTVHGITKTGICVPLLHCIITSSTAKTYRDVFSLLRKQLVKAEFEIPRLTFITDFERASINASQEIFKECDHQGCSFHYVRCLLRAKSGHLNDCMTADKKVHTWFRRIVALVYFPQQYIELTGLLEPPEGISEEAIQPVNQFIQYFKSNWLENDSRKGMWNKFMIVENRTTNFAENYHGRMIDTVETKNPTLNVLIDAINDDSFESYTRLKNNERKLRKEDLERKEAVEKAMVEFSTKMQEVGIKNMTQEEFYQYLDYMSHLLPTTLK